MKRLLAAVFATLLTIGLPAIGAAQDGDAAAKAAAGARFERGVELYGEGDYEAALVEFRRAYEIAPGYQVLYNTALAQFQLGDYAGALKTLEKYLADGGDAIDEKRRANVQDELAKLRQRVGTLEVVVGEPGAEVTIDDAPKGKTPLDGPLLVSIGRRKVVVTKGARRVDRLVDVGGGDALRVELQLPSVGPSPASPDPAGPSPQPAPTPLPSEPADDGPDAVAITLWSFTGALAVGAAITGPLALVAANDLADMRETFGTTQLEREDQQATAQRLALTTDVLIGAAAVMGTISLVVTLTSGDDEGADDAKLRFTPTGLGFSTSF